MTAGDTIMKACIYTCICHWCPQIIDKYCLTLYNAFSLHWSQNPSDYVPLQ